MMMMMIEKFTKSHKESNVIVNNQNNTHIYTKNCLATTINVRTATQ